MRLGINAWTLTACLVITAFCAAKAQAPMAKWEHLLEGSPILAGRDQAWIVQEPRVISTGPSEAMTFGPSAHEAVVVTRSAVKLTPQTVSGSSADNRQGVGFKLNVINLITGSTKAITLPATVQQVSELSWVSKQRVLAVHALSSDSHFTVLVDVVGGGVFSSQGNMSEGAIISEVESLALLRSYDFRNPEADVFIRVIDFSVTPARWTRIQLPKGAGRPLVLTSDKTVICASPAKGQVEFSLQDGSVRPWVPRQDGSQSILQIAQAEVGPVWSEVRPEPNSGLWLLASPGVRSELRLSKEADSAEMNDKRDKILFRAHGAVFQCDLTPVNLDAAAKALGEHAKSQAISMAKQAGTAMHIYSSDYDGLMPLSGASAWDALFPYMKSAKILDSVVWTNVTGQNLSKISNSGSYEIGFVPGPGGNAVIYADGSVGWSAKP